MELTPSPLSVGVFKLFERLDAEYSLNRPSQIADKDLLELFGIFGDQLRAALDIIDREKIGIHRRKSDNREYIEIVLHQNSIYKLLPNINYCMCTEFHDKVLGTRELYTCHHVLAAKLALLTGRIKIELHNDDAFTYSLQMIRAATFTANPINANLE